MTSNLIRTTTVTITNGTAISGASEDLSTLGKLAAIILPSGWTTQSVTFQVSTDGVNYYNLYNEGTEYALSSVLASTFQRLDIALFYGVNYVKVRSGTAASPQNQAGGDIVTLVCWQLE